MNKLLLSNVGDKPIIWVAHSMGGKINILNNLDVSEKNIVLFLYLHMLYKFPV